MRILTLNANGIRSATRKGFFDWLPAQQADVICLQETRIQDPQIDEGCHPPDYHCHYVHAGRKGYSGVAVYSRRPPDAVLRGLGWPDFDAEGRWLELRFGNLSVVSLYLPSGSSGPERQQVKFNVLDRFTPLLQTLRENGRDYVLCGDWNIAHKPIDLKNWRSNQKNSGFLPEERAWMDQVFGPLGFADAFRVVNTESDQYTWWSNRGRARANNVGWRIDYQVITPDLVGRVRAAHIYKEQWFSDHAPLTLDYDYDF